ncbi:MAG: hypothetical protein QNJ03_00135 [Dinoroseobacter sp.]|nr:hypothetical protein [Dinoroseobacter sp.]
MTKVYQDIQDLTPFGFYEMKRRSDALKAREFANAPDITDAERIVRLEAAFAKMAEFADEALCAHYYVLRNRLPLHKPNQGPQRKTLKRMELLERVVQCVPACAATADALVAEVLENHKPKAHQLWDQRRNKLGPAINRFLAEDGRLKHLQVLSKILIENK